MALQYQISRIDDLEQVHVHPFSVFGDFFWGSYSCWEMRDDEVSPLVSVLGEEVGHHLQWIA